MIKRDRDQSIENEPHLRSHFSEDASEQHAEAALRREARRHGDSDAVDHTVWDEPALSSELAGAAAADQVTFSRWLAAKQAETSWAKSWLVTVAVAMVAGPWGVLGALMGGGQSASGLVMVTLIGPITEEIMKIAAALWVIEKRPYLFKSMVQIFICAAAGGAAFAFIENLMYLYVYIPEHSFGLAAWRWTVCVGLHVNCSFVAGVGLARIWDNAIRTRHRPQLGLGVAWFVTAMAGHGLYNGAVTLAESAGWLEL